MISRRRRLGAVVALLAAGGLSPAIAGGHGGAVLASTRAGPFQVTLTAAPLLVPGRPQAIDYTAYVNDAATGTPVADAHVAYTVGQRGGTRHPLARLIGGGYEAVVSTDDARSRYRTTPVTVVISSPLGDGRVQITPHAGPPPGMPSWLLPITALVGLALAAIALRTHRSRARRQGTAPITR